MELGAGTKGLSDKMTVEQDVRLCNQAKYCSTQVAAQNLVLYCIVLYCYNTVLLLGYLYFTHR